MLVFRLQKCSAEYVSQVNYKITMKLIRAAGEIKKITDCENHRLMASGGRK